MEGWGEKEREWGRGERERAMEKERGKGGIIL